MMRFIRTVFGSAIMRLSAYLTRSCREICADASRALDTEPSLGQRIVTRMHVLLCPFCRRYCVQVRLLRQGADAYAEPALNPAADALSADARQRLRERLRQAR